MKVWIDNDGCPKMVRELVFRSAARRGFAVTVVANSYMHVPPSPIIKMIVVSDSFDAADDYIAEAVEAGDLVITADIPLAGRIVEKGALGLSPRGELFDPSNIGERLAMRNLMTELRSGGEIQGGPPPLGEADKKRFADGFDRAVTSLLRS